MRCPSPHAIPDTAFPEPCLLTETENTIIDHILELLKVRSLTSHQSRNLLERLGRIIEVGSGGEGNYTLTRALGIIRRRSDGNWRRWYSHWDRTRKTYLFINASVRSNACSGERIRRETRGRFCDNDRRIYSPAGVNTCPLNSRYRYHKNGVSTMKPTKRLKKSNCRVSEGAAL